MGRLKSKRPTQYVAATAKIPQKAEVNRAVITLSPPKPTSGA